MKYFNLLETASLPFFKSTFIFIKTFIPQISLPLKARDDAFKTELKDAEENSRDNSRSAVRYRKNLCRRNPSINTNYVMDVF